MACTIIHVDMVLYIQLLLFQMLDILQSLRKNGVSVNGLWIQDWSGSIKTSFGKRVFWNWRWDQVKYPSKKLNYIITFLNFICFGRGIKINDTSAILNRHTCGARGALQTFLKLRGPYKRAAQVRKERTR